MNRRLFFGTILGAFLGSKLTPIGEVPRFTSGGFVNFGAGTLSTLHGPEYLITLEQAAAWFNVPPELIGPPSTLMLDVTELPERVGVANE